MFGKKIGDILSSLAVYYKKDAGGYWDTITQCNILTKPEKLGKYYLDFSSKANYPGEFENNGIPLYQGGYQPVVICQYALGLFELLSRENYLDTELKNKFLVQADWLVTNSTKSKNCTTWLIEKKIADYSLVKPFSSALCQGEAISVLLRAHLISNNQIYIRCAEEALKIFDLPAEEGGIKNSFDGYSIYEEYPSLKVNFVLNGFIFSLFGLYDFIIVNNNSKSKELFYKGIETIEKLLPIFDTGYWSQYNLYFYPRKYLASIKYHLIHVEQLQALYVLTNKEIFLKYSKKWAACGSSFTIKSYALFKKIMNKNIVKE